MRPRKVTFTVAILIALAAPALSSGADWPQFLGPGRTGISSETGLARTWPPDGPPVLWTADVGPGFSGPAVQNGEVFLLDRVGEAQDKLRCFDLETGKELWSSAYDAPGNFQHYGARPTPAVDDKHILTIDAFSNLYCFDRAAHTPLWNKNLIEEFGGSMPNWAVGQNVLPYKNLAIVAPQVSATAAVAYDKATGAVVWKTPAEAGSAGYVSPTLIQIAGEDQVVLIGSAGAPRGALQVVGVSPDDGHLLWSYSGWKCPIAIPNVAPAGDGRLFVTGGYKAGSVMIQVVKNGESFGVNELWRLPEVGSQIQLPILWQDHLYTDNNENGRNDGIACVSLDGKVLWKQTPRDGGPRFDRGNLLLADGMIYVIDREGALRLFEPNPQGYKELASAPELSGNELWAPMALSGGKLIIRDHKILKCLDVRAK